MLQLNPLSTNAPLGFASPVLAEDDVRRLMEENSPELRTEITEKLASTYNGDTLDKNALIAAEQVFRLLVRDTEVAVRKTLANHLKNSSHIPRDVVRTLARDVEEVALPVLQFSEVLTENDLLELTSTQQDVSRYLAISRRKTVPESVSQVLIDSGNPQVATTLASNVGAKISESGFDKLVELHQCNEAVLKSVGENPAIPVTVAGKLVTLVSDQLADALRKKHNLPASQISRAVEQTHEDETLALVRIAKTELDAERLSNQLQTNNNLTPSIILSALAQGNFAFFEICLARLSNIPVANARTLIGDRGDLGFRAIYNKAGLPEGLFPAVKLLLTVVRELDFEGIRPGSIKYAGSIVERLLNRAEYAPVENLSYVIALVRRVAR